MAFTVIFHVELFPNLIYYHTLIKPHPGTSVWGKITIFLTLKAMGPGPTGGGTRESLWGLRSHSASCSQKRSRDFSFLGSTLSASPHPAPWLWKRSMNKSLVLFGGWGGATGAFQSWAGQLQFLAVNLVLCFFIPASHTVFSAVKCGDIILRQLSC